MVERFTSNPLELPPPELPITRADLVFYGVDHSGPTFEGRVFLGAPRNLDGDAGPEHPNCVGSFFVFGHGECRGDEGHCEVPEERPRFDLRLPHHLEPAIHILTVTEAVESLIAAAKTEARVTVIAHLAETNRRDRKVLSFDTARLATYL